MRYVDYVVEYTPKNTDLICDFHIEPLGVSMREAAGGVAAESSIGTWTELTTSRRYVEKLAAKVFSVRGNEARIAYPIELFEAPNIPNILSSVAGNVFGLKTLKNLRLNGIEFPDAILRHYKGPQYGIAGIRRLFRVKRPLVGTIIKPKLGLRTADHARVAYEAWLGGCDVCKDDENLSSQSFNKFEARLEKTLEARDRAEQETGEKKGYLVNVTAPYNEMLRRAELAQRQGNEYAMVDIITTGFSALQELREQNFKLIFHAHRAGHAAFTKSQRHGISMRVIARLARMCGMDQLHVGTVVGKMYETKQEVLENVAALKQKMAHLKPAMPVASGGLHPGNVPALYGIFGSDVIMQFGGGIHGHPLGTSAGATAVRQALDAALAHAPLPEYAQSRKELAVALQHFRA